VLLVYNAVNLLSGFFNIVMGVFAYGRLSDKNNRKQRSYQMEYIGGRAVDFFIDFCLAGIKIHPVFLHGSWFFGKGNGVFGKITFGFAV